VCTFGGRAEPWLPFRRILERLGPWCPGPLRLWTGSADDGDEGSAARVDRAIATVEPPDDDLDPRQVLRVAGTALHLGRPGARRDDLWRLVRDGRAGGAVGSALRALLVLALDAYHEGRWERAEDLGHEAITLSTAHGYALLALPARYVLALIAAARGDRAAVRELTDQLTGWGIPRGARRAAVYSAHARTLAALGHGDFENAYRESTALPGHPASGPDRGWAWSPTLDRVEAAARTHHSSEALAHVATARAAAVTSMAPRPSFLAAGGAAMVATGAHAGLLFEAALAAPDVERWPFDLARLRLAHGEHLRRARSTRAAREQLSRALRTFEELGAQPWAARAATELRAAGHDPERGTREQPHAKRPPLTAQEFEVAGLAASGMTSRQIADRLHISHRTVDAHLYRVFPKLDITGRAALRDALDRYRE
jgi:DNA-binding CsgD family transcriptional regulator